MDRKLILLLTLLLVSGVALTLAAFFFGIFSFDLEVALRLREFGHPVFIAVLGVVSSPGDGGVPAILVAMTAAICAFKKKWLEAVFVVATLSAVLLAGVLKVLIGRPRPLTFTMNLYDLVPPDDLQAAFRALWPVWQSGCQRAGWSVPGRQTATAG